METMTIPMHTPPEATEVLEPVSFEVPEDYKDKAYLKDVKDINDVYKMLDGAQTLIGQKITFPTEKSTPEAIFEFNKAAGMPEKPDGYAFEKVGEDERVPEIDNKIKEIFHKHGISAKAASGITKDTELLTQELTKLKTEQEDAEFDALSTKVFGDKKDQILASGKKLLEENIPDEFKEDFSKLPNKDLVLMAGVLDKIKAKYISEDVINPGGIISGGETKESLNNQLSKLMSERQKMGGFHPGYKDICDRITGLCNKIAQYKD